MSNHARRSRSRPWAPTAQASEPFVLPQAASAPPSPSPPSAVEIITIASAVAAHLDGPAVAELAARLAAGGGTATRANLAVLARLLPEPLDRELAGLELGASDAPLPGWADRFDEVDVAAVVQLRDPLGDAVILVLELRWPDTAPVVLVLLVDHNLGSTIKVAALLSRSMDALLASFAAETEDELVRTALATADARAMIEVAVWPPAPVDPGELGPADLRPLVEWLIARLPTGGTAPGRPSTTEAERRAIRTRFFDSPWGRALNVPRRSHVVDALLDLAADEDDPLRWSRARLGHLDLEALTDDPWFEPNDPAAVPDLLRALIGFAHEERGIARRHTDAAMAVVDQACWPLRSVARAWSEPVPASSWAEDRLDRLAAQVGSRAVLASLDDTPLPDEPFLRHGILPEVLPAADAVLAVVDDLCERFFDIELRTAARRLLAAIARRSGSVVRHGRTDTTAAGVVWLVATANGAFHRHGVRQKDVRAHLDLSSALSSRAHSLRRAPAGESDGPTSSATPDCSPELAEARSCRSAISCSRSAEPTPSQPSGDGYAGIREADDGQAPQRSRCPPAPRGRPAGHDHLGADPGGDRGPPRRCSAHLPIRRRRRQRPRRPVHPDR